MLARTYDDQVCSTARALEVVGERWSLLLVRDAFLGRSRFEQFQTSLGIGRNVLTNRLSRLVEAGVLERIRYHQHPPTSPERLELRADTSTASSSVDSFRAAASVTLWNVTDPVHPTSGPTADRPHQHRQLGGVQP